MGFLDRLALGNARRMCARKACYGYLTRSSVPLKWQAIASFGAKSQGPLHFMRILHKDAGGQTLRGRLGEGRVRRSRSKRAPPFGLPARRPATSFSAVQPPALRPSSPASRFKQRERPALISLLDAAARMLAQLASSQKWQICVDVSCARALAKARKAEGLRARRICRGQTACHELCVVPRAAAASCSSRAIANIGDFLPSERG